ncbi:hypothetical protein QZH41_006386, partial [Actinostola sp. cb2023]
GEALEVAAGYWCYGMVLGWYGYYMVVVVDLGYDKLKPYGFPIHGAIDGFSRRILWLEVVKSNNDPRVPGKFFLEYVKEVGGCPLLLVSDCGTENGIAAASSALFVPVDKMIKLERVHIDSARGLEQTYYSMEECLVSVSTQQALDMEQHCELVEEENVYQEYFEYILDTEGLNYPSNVEEALQLFQRVIDLN